MGARKNGRARGRHATPSPLACLPLVHPFFLAPTTSYYFQAPATWVCQRLFPRRFRFLSIGKLRVIKRGLEFLRKDSTLSFVNSIIIIVCHLHFLTFVTQSYQPYCLERNNDESDSSVNYGNKNLFLYCHYYIVAKQQ